MNPFTKAIDVLKNGGVGLLPSDTIYGLSCVALNEEAVERIHKLKGRDSNKPLIVLLADIEQAKELVLDPKDLEAASGIWPAPLTIIAPAENAPEFLHRGTKTLAVRVPDKEELRKFIREVGPIVSSSANLQGEKPAESVEEAKKYFANQLDFYLDVGELKGQPSTLARIVNGEVKVLRQGAYKI